MGKFGILSKHTLKIYSDIYQDNYDSFLKRSMILFDQLVYPDKSSLDLMRNSILKEKSIDKKEIDFMFRDIRDFISGQDLFSMGITIFPESNLLYGYSRDKFLDFIGGFLLSKYNIDFKNYDTKSAFDLVDFYTSALSSDFTFLFEMSKRNNEITAMYTNLHRDAYFATYSDSITVYERILEKVSTLNFFDFSQLTWSQIIELKKSDFISDFRKKLYEWADQSSRIGNENQFEKELDRYIREVMFKFIYKNKPNVILDVATGILSNIPMPMLNPISIYTSVNQIQKDINTNKSFGWLFFIQEAFQKSLQE